MIEDGGIIIARRILNSDLIQYPNALTLFMYLLVNANWKDRVACLNQQEIHVKRGQAIFGLLQASSVLKMPIRQLRTALNYLISTGRATREATNKYSIVTLCKYNDYQNIKNYYDKQGDIQTDNQPTCNRHATDMQPTTPKEGKEGNKEINNTSAKAESSNDDKRRGFIHPYLQTFCKKYEEKFKRPYVIGDFGKLNKQAKGLAGRVGEFDLLTAVHNFLADDSEFVSNSGHAFGMFVAKINAYLKGEKVRGDW